MFEMDLTEKAAEKRREYKRQWCAKNRDKCREHTRRYWEKKALADNERITNNRKAGN